MKKVFTMLVGLLIAFQVAATKKNPQCNGEAYSSEIVKTEKVSETCVRYEIKVSYDGTRTYGLSHYSIAIPCGEIKDASNSEGWPMVVGKDRTTGITGLKVDNINGFGERRKDSFTLSFTWCSSGTCGKEVGVVAYKFGTCVSYDTLSNPTPPVPPQTCSSLTGSLQKVNVTCAGQNTGRLEVVIQEGTAPYTYAWSNGSKTNIIENVPAGSYAVTVKDAKGNVLTLRGEVTAPTPIVISESVINPVCSGQYTGAINLEITGGTGDYTFAWSTGESTQNLTDLSSGYYSVTVTDSLGCSAVKAMMLTNGTLISAEADLRHPTCSESDGAIDLTPIGGTAPYTYMWSNGATTQDLQNLAAGTYVVTITDASGCLAYKIYTLLVTSPVLIQNNVTPAACDGGSTGGIDLTLSGGKAPYKVLWSDGVTTEDRANLPVGGYQVTVTDAAGCTATSAVYVDTNTLDLTSTVVQPVCAGGLGSITITPAEGSGTYTYTWSNGQTGNTIDNLPPGNYTVTVANAKGCQEFQSFWIMAPGAITVTGTVTNAQCGATDAYGIDLSVFGGNYPYTYLWSNGATSEDISGLTAGTYSVDVKDNGGCTVKKQFVIDAASLSWSCLINPVSTSVVCGSVGNVLNTVVKGAASYEWTVTSTDNNWSITSSAADSAIVFTAGNPGSSATFTLTIVKNGCTQTCTYTVTGGCVERDNTGGGDPSSSEPCGPTTPTTPTTPPTTPPVEEPTTPTTPTHGGCKGGVDITAYPNPFHDRVKLEWTAEANEHVRLEIYDARGKRIRTLCDQKVEAGKKYSFEWAAEGCREPLYYYRCTTSKGVTHGKLARSR